MSKKLAGRTILITGAGRGIGKEVACACAEEGATLILSSRSKHNLESTKALCEQRDVCVYATCADMSSKDDVARLFKQTVAQINSLDALITTVGGVNPFGGFEMLSDADWEQSFDFNVLTAVRPIREAIPLLKKSSSARIIIIGSIVAHQPGFMNPHYSAAKAALANLSKHLSNTLAQYGILVNMICPNSLKGERWDDSVADHAQRTGFSYADMAFAMEQEEIQKIPLKKLASPKDIASLVTFLCSVDNHFITGACINVDGGTTRSIF